MVTSVKKILFNKRGYKRLDIHWNHDSTFKRIVFRNKLKKNITITSDEWLLIADNLKSNLPAFISGVWKKPKKSSDPIIISDTWLIRIELSVPSGGKKRTLVMYEKFPWLPELDVRFNEIVLTKRDAKLLLNSLEDINNVLHLELDDNNNTILPNNVLQSSAASDTSVQQS
ncbi:unnamed protein product [Nesidiocoris tenuis]|uniref:Uncharacterized protein n=1 Tax=Nesidiocoris tenuis TaxID=355587 RepID=A0A6H5G5N3_9HEMI|nr:unnamed protein product [Nesidiocoris tenuis]